ncbi:MAG: hypothetical protein H7Z37_15240, partial [Pyrinomonadaceae bacterium]|nr:hypothetical protein [Pyrinomonadaceae bacterium]
MINFEGEGQNSGPINEKTGGKNDIIVVGIGASAGGIKALKELFAKMPSDSGMAFVVILHLSQTHESNLAAILQTQTEMPVEQVSETLKVERNHVYVIPPGKHLEMIDGVISLREPERIKGRRVPIDIFFRTLGENYGKNAVAIVLSGTGSDGSSGLKRVKEFGGVTIVQDPKEAEYDGMPLSAIGTGLIDLVLNVEAIPEKLLKLRNSPADFLIPRLETKNTFQEVNADSMHKILTLMRIRTGHDFANYKQATLLRRITRRLQVNEVEDLNRYLSILTESPDEVQALLRDFLISVTNFFRDAESFEALERNVIPQIFAGKTSKDEIRAWVVSCATGEEAYSIAILMQEYVEKNIDSPKIQVFASDIDENAILMAREGRYDESITADVSPERLNRFFIKEGNSYRLRKEIRELVLFTSHNVLRDPPFSKL